MVSLINKAFTILICVLFGFSCFTQSTSIIGDWVLKKNGDKETFDLQISDDKSVLFAQTVFKSPCIYNFKGELKDDTIFYNTKLFCEKYEDQIMLFKWSRNDTFVIKHFDTDNLIIQKIGQDEVLEYNRMKE